MTEIVKICKKHGELTYEQVHKDKDGFRCAECRRDSSNKSRVKYRDARNATSKRWREINKEQYKKSLKSNRDKYIEALNDFYVRDKIARTGFDRSKITQEMVEIKKVLLKINRLKKAAKNDS